MCNLRSVRNPLDLPCAPSNFRCCCCCCCCGNRVWWRFVSHCCRSVRQCLPGFCGLQADIEGRLQEVYVALCNAIVAARLISEGRDNDEQEHDRHRAQNEHGWNKGKRNVRV